MRTFSALMLVLVVLGGLAFTACAPQDPETRLLETRARYTVKLNTWLPRENLAAAEPNDAAAVIEDEVMADDAMADDATADDATADDAMADDAMVDDAMADEGVDGEEVAMEPGGPQPTSILFDLLVRFEGDEPLPGITLDVTHADGSEAVKETRHQWVDTSDLLSGVPKQIDFVLDGFLFEDGDIFSVELRQVVPPAERSAYREFAGLGS